MACIAGAYLDGWPVLQPTCGFMTNVYTYAKKNLYKGVFWMKSADTRTTD